MNFRLLLVKYMQLLHECENSSFLELANSPFSPQVRFTDEEMKCLRQIESEINSPVSTEAVAD